MKIEEYPKATRVFFETAAKALREMDPRDICDRTGISYSAHEEKYTVPFLGSLARIGATDYEMEWDRPIQSMYHITILHYMLRADGSRPKGEWISLYDAAPLGSTRINQMLRANIPPLIDVFSDDLEAFFAGAETLGGEKISGDTAEIRILPHIPTRITIWPKDDEFPADARVLFDQTLHRQLYAEDIVYTADVVVQALIAASGKAYTFPA